MPPSKAAVAGIARTARPAHNATNATRIARSVPTRRANAPLQAPAAAKHIVGKVGTNATTTAPAPSSPPSCSRSAEALLIPSRRLKAISTTAAPVSQAARDLAVDGTNRTNVGAVAGMSQTYNA